MLHSSSSPNLRDLRASIVGTHIDHEGMLYRVWAPDHRSITALIESADGDARSLALESETDGYFSALDHRGAPGDRYQFQLDEGETAPDPASRFQPDGVFGPSAVIDPQQFTWRNTEWKRPPLRGRVLYEIHVGTFTPRGTFLAAIDRLDTLVRLGVNTIQIMPVADFPGRWNWGYDGTMLFAPARCYGAPDDLRALVDAAHDRGLGVILDVVYNHLGSDGNHLQKFSRRYFKDTANSWGSHFNIDEEGSEAVRSFFVQNACMWMDEFRMDGLRLDATHAIADESDRHLVAEITDAVHQRGGFVILEDERNESRLLCPGADGGWEADAIWTDDFHHSLRVALTHERQSYYGSFSGEPREIADALEHGWIFRGQHFPFWDRARGSECREAAPECFVHCISNHDQVGNRLLGERLNQLVSRDAYAAASVLLCLTPFTPMFFMGQEWASESPFLFFSDLPKETGSKRADGRREEFRRTGICTDEKLLAEMPDPQDEETFRKSKLDWKRHDETPHREMFSLHAACLALRSREAVFQNPARGRWRTAAVGGTGLAIRWSDAENGDRLLIFMLEAGPASVALDDSIVTAASGRRWDAVLSSNEPRFGGDQPLSIDIAFSQLAQFGPGAWLWRETAV